MGILKILWDFRSTIILVFLPILCLPLPLVFRSTEAACGFCIIVVAGYWISECLPLAVTSFLPLILFPLMGIMKSSDVSVVYFKDTNWLFVGGLIIAVGVEYTNLHRRIALAVLLLVGTSPQRLMIGFMLPTYFLSMWISNTATTAMMIPIVNAVLMELRKEESDMKKAGEMDAALDTKEDSVEFDEKIEMEVTVFSNRNVLEKEDNDIEKSSLNEEKNSISDVDIIEDGDNDQNANEQVDSKREVLTEPTPAEKGLTICVPYAASIGGITTLTGTGPNVVIAGQYPMLVEIYTWIIPTPIFVLFIVVPAYVCLLYPDADPQINFGNWMAYHLPLSLLMLGLTYLWLMWLYLGIKFKSADENKSTRGRRIRAILKGQYASLGDIKWNEVTVVVVLTTTVLLWFFREPGFMPGWAVIFKDDFVSDGTVAMTMATLLFILPSKRPTFLGRRPDNPNDLRPVPAVIDWKTVNAMMPWSVVFLIGGGFALAEGATVSGFSDWLASQLAVLGGIPSWVICLIVTVITCLFTECTSNVATASLFIPIISELAQVLEVHPLYFLLPTVVATSLAFMLPVATPPNAIAFSYGYLKVVDLVKSGWLLNILGVLLLMVFINSYAIVIYGVNEFPEWAASNYSSS